MNILAEILFQTIYEQNPYLIWFAGRWCSRFLFGRSFQYNLWSCGDSGPILSYFLNIIPQVDAVHSPPLSSEFYAHTHTHTRTSELRCSREIATFWFSVWVYYQDIPLPPPTGPGPLQGYYRTYPNAGPGSYWRQPSEIQSPLPDPLPVGGANPDTHRQNHWKRAPKRLF